MKRFLAALLCMMIALLPVIALAASLPDEYAYGDEPQPIKATLNQKMALRSGPGTKYTELGTYPKDTPITLYEQVVGGSATWGMIEFRASGGLMRAYTGMKRIDTSSKVPWANTTGYSGKVGYTTTPRRGPGEEYVALKSKLNKGAKVTIYNEERGWLLVDFTYPGSDELVRAYIPAIDLAPAY